MSEWKEIELGQYVDILSSKRIFAADYVPEGIPFFRSKEVIERAFGQDISNPLYITEKRFQDIKLKYGSPINGDILISAVGERAGIPYLVHNEGDFYFKDGNLIWFRKFSKELDSEYLVYFLKSRIGQFQLENLMIGSAQKALTIIGLKGLVISVPGINQQKEIAKTLSNLDKKITLLRQQNQDLEELAQVLFKRWFVEFEFPNENGEPYKSSGGKMVESELGEIPERWKVGCLGDEFTILMGQSPAGSSYNEIKEGKVFYQGRTDFGFRFPTNRLYTTEPKRIADKFDVLVSVRAPVGDVNMASEECCIGRGLGAVKSVLKSYCFNKIKSLKKAFDVFENEGTVFGSLSKNDFNSLEVIVPEKHVTELYEQVAFKLDLKIFENTNKIQTLTQLRDTLLPKLMCGELRVNKY